MCCRYLFRKLGIKVCDNPLTVRLKFEPSGRAVDEVGQYYTQEKANRCVVCGSNKSYIRKNIVPREYRRHFPGKRLTELCCDFYYVLDPLPWGFHIGFMNHFIVHGKAVLFPLPSSSPSFSSCLLGFLSSYIAWGLFSLVFWKIDGMITVPELNSMRHFLNDSLELILCLTNINVILHCSCDEGPHFTWCSPTVSWLPPEEQQFWCDAASTACKWMQCTNW